MRDLFDQLKSEGEAAVRALVTDQRQEGVDLEFKTKVDPANGDLTRDDRKTLGIILSAFANSIGGLLVWGVEGRKNQDDIDCATALKPIAEIEKFKSKVVSAAAQVLMPRHESVFVEAIPGTPQGSGYLAVYVERSERRPHRCEVGDRQYYKRAGDSSFVMEHYDIEDSFKRLTIPIIDLDVYIDPRGGSRSSGPEGEHLEWSVRLMLKNISTVSARYPYLIMEQPTGWQLPRFVAPAAEGFALTHQPNGLHFNGGADIVIHPESYVQVTALRRLVPIASVPEGFRVRRKDLGSMRITYRCGCYNSRQTSGIFELRADDLIKGVENGHIE